MTSQEPPAADASPPPTAQQKQQPKWNPRPGGLTARVRAALWYLVVHHATVGVLCSLVISIPLAVFKYQLALNDEGALALTSFNGVAESLVQTVENAFQAGRYGPSMVAAYYMTANGTITQSQWSALTYYGGYFSVISSNFLSFVYQHVTADTLASWRQFMLDHTKDSSGAEVIDTTRTDFYYVSHITNMTQNKAVLGYMASTDEQHRRPLIETVATSGAPACSNRLTLATSNVAQSAVIVLAPIFRNESSGALTKTRTGSMVAAAGVGLPVQDVLTTALSLYYVNPNIDIFLLDEGANSTGSQYLGHYSPTYNATLDLYNNFMNFTESDVLALPYDYRYIADISPLDRPWRVVVLGRPGYANGVRTDFPLRLLFISLTEPAFAIAFHAAMWAIHRLYNVAMRRRSSAASGTWPGARPLAYIGGGGRSHRGSAVAERRGQAPPAAS
ncbi:hypothetical protein HK405_011998, partial [Cladochytrium tenue]